MSRRFNKHRGTKISIRHSGKWAWLFVLIVLLLGVYIRTTDQYLGYFLIAMAVILGGYKILKQHW